MATLAALLQPGVVGTYTHFEVTEVFAEVAVPKKQVINVFTLIVAEEREGKVLPVARYLTARIKLKSLPDWIFGVKQYTRPIADLIPALASMTKTGDWCASGQALHVGKLNAVSGQFVPPDASEPVPWNRVLKNNFWNGSHLFEWADIEKKALQPLFDDPPRLQELSQKVSEGVPIRLAGLSDRLGNVVVQLPVTAIMSKFAHLRQSGDFVVNLAWRPNVPARNLRASCAMEFDGVVDSYAAGPIQAPQTVLAADPSFGVMKGYIWDDANQIVLAATGSLGFIHAVGMNIVPVGSEPRTWSVPNEDGTLIEHRIGVAKTMTSLVGNKNADDNGGFTRKRLYKEQLDQKIASQVFVQYKPDANGQDAEHEKALKDLRQLINRYGQKGAWLWDPYLSADDILETLFYCPHDGADLRALTRARQPRADGGLCARVGRWLSKLLHGERPDFVQQHRERLNSVRSNWVGLRLEYRVRRGGAGFGFHDRFLIFPRTEEAPARAWSLGTSVNILGKEHHILQQVDDGQLVADAFEELWTQLDKPEHLIWKKP